MKSLLKKIISFIVQNDLLWGIFNSTIIRIADHATWERQEKANAKIVDIKKTILSLSPNLSVKNGPFKGMLYPEVRSIGSALAPKIIGSYERELHEIVEIICKSGYTEIVDVGCAEGYYAIGLTIRIDKANSFAYDTNEQAIYLCREMAKLNNVSDRLITGNYCDANTLRSIPIREKAIIISDCEAYEKDLFTDEIVTCLAHHDFLIESHDFIDIEISAIIRQRFQRTHRINTIQSVDDAVKPHLYDYEELRPYSLAARKLLLSERSQNVQWFYMTSRLNEKS